MAEDPTIIEFPCDFSIKIFGKNDPDFVEEIKSIGKKHYPELEEASISIQESAKGSYISITLTVFAQDKQTLDALYIELSNHPDIKMVL